jgi:hypothetical protein
MVSVEASPHWGFVHLGYLQRVDLLEVEARNLGAELEQLCYVLDQELLEWEREGDGVSIRKEEVSAGYELLYELSVIQKGDLLLVVEDYLADEAADAYEDAVFRLESFGWIELGQEGHRIGEIDDAFRVAQELNADI